MQIIVILISVIVLNAKCTVLNIYVRRNKRKMGVVFSAYRTRNFYL